MKEFTLKQAVDACNGEYHGEPRLLERAVRGVAIDNRKIRKDFLFVPIKGERFDGHDFIPSAYENGALACVSERPLPGGRPYILAASSLRAFQEIAAFYKGLFSVKTFAITGSAGKTSTKEMLWSVLSKRFHVLKTQGNLNNQTGVPLTLLELEEAHEVAVVEMGTNHFGEIRSLARTARPDFCILTNIGTAHIEHLGSREGILKAKCEMLEYLRPGGRVFVNGDDDLLRTLKETRSDVTSFGLGPDNDIGVETMRKVGLAGTDVTVRYSGGTFPVHVPSPGEHMVTNALAAVAAGLAVGMEPGLIAAGIAAYRPVGDRMRMEQGNGVTVLNDAYNANPGAVRAAIDVLRLAEGRTVCVLGDMLELGERAEALHAQTGEYAARQGIALLLCVGPLSRHTAEGMRRAGGEAVWFATQEELWAHLANYVHAGDFVLVKASRGMRMEKTADRLLGRQSGPV